MEWYFFYSDSLNQRHQLNYRPYSFNNLMEFIRDQGYEDWGDCRGRSWCATCHVKISNAKILPPPDEDEKFRLSKMSNKMNTSRLACQMLLSKNIHKMEIKFIGAD